MAMDPNHALRTHQRVFTGIRASKDAALKAAAWAAVPKCKTCGAAVMFEGDKVKHYDNRWNGDKTANSIIDSTRNQNRALVKDGKIVHQGDHEAEADKPTEQDILKVSGTPKPGTGDLSNQAINPHRRTNIEPGIISSTQFQDMFDNDGVRLGIAEIETRRDKAAKDAAAAEENN